MPSLHARDAEKLGGSVYRVVRIECIQMNHINSTQLFELIARIREYMQDKEHSHLPVPEQRCREKITRLKNLGLSSGGRSAPFLEILPRSALKQVIS